MGIVKNWAVKKIKSAADAEAALSSLAPKQVKDIDEKKQRYLETLNEKNDRGYEISSHFLNSAGIEIFNSYLPKITEVYTPIEYKDEERREFSSDNRIRFFKINKWVTDKEENSLEKLINVYAVIANEKNCNIALVFHRMTEKTDVYIAVVNLDNNDSNDRADELSSRIFKALKGNFPGSEIGKKQDGRIQGEQKLFDSFDKRYSVATATNVASEKSEKFISQTIEKLIDGIVPKSSKEEYTLILLATPITDSEERRNTLSQIYSALFPYSAWQTNYSFNSTDSQSSNFNGGINLGLSAGIQQSNSTSYSEGHSDTVSDSSGTSTGENVGESTSDTQLESSSKSDQSGSSSVDTVSDNKSEQTGHSVSNMDSKNESRGNAQSQNDGSYSGESGGIDFKVGSISVNGGVNAGKNHSSTDTTSYQFGNAQSITITDSSLSSEGTGHATSNGTSSSTTISNSVSESVTKTISKATSKAITNTLGKALTTAVNTAQGVARSANLGGNFGVNFSRSSTVVASIGENEGITQSFINFSVKHMLEVLDDQMKRYDQCSALGMWDFAAYVISKDPDTANNVAHTYLALTQGEKSYVSQSSVNLWNGEKDEQSTEKILSYLKNLMHPKFVLAKEALEFPTAVTATTALSGKELAYSLNMPRKSISGLPVLECGTFGRNVVLYDAKAESTQTINIGKIFHMNNEETSGVELSTRSLTSHTFITGSTGAGKSNTVYQMLKSAKEQGTKFLVIEPAKGEYKHVFGNDDDVSVYSTNPQISELLKINPFSFPSGIHVLEHLDRLIEIFNVCWPMYAAMPAVLKKAVEKSYEDCGWDLVSSTNEYGNGLYPSFSDVAGNIRTIIDNSEYDTDNKGAYKGSLLTRLESLSNGINGLIFTNNEISDKNLFDENVIIDLSRVGSSETKSLIMGMLVVKLQEYRMTNGEMNSPLKHLTVLEEAHNLLKRTSTEQSSDSSNLVGKSVEMISNAIAEMRTYGEGFIIADQAPGLLDMSVIRNTNTKIIMRLPDYDDRELVGKAANLNESQITELARLRCGVAAIYQNEWITPVLCKVNECRTDNKRYEYVPKGENPKSCSADKLVEIAKLLSDGTKLEREVIFRDVFPVLKEQHIKASVIVSVIKHLESPPKEPRMTKLAPIMSALFPKVKSAVVNAYKSNSDASEWTYYAEEALLNDLSERINDRTRRDIIQAIITDYLYLELDKQNDLQKWAENGGLK